MNDVILYHGSRSGIKGNIEPKSRDNCDFGSGFYMGTIPEQAKTLVYNNNTAIFYTLKLELSKIPERKILTLNGMDWAFYVLYNRNKLESIKETDFYKKLSSMDNDKDIIIGPIADDNMNKVMKKFCNNEITDKALLESIRCINYGIQYVAKTENACSNIIIQSKEPIDMSKHEEYTQYKNTINTENNRRASIIQKQYRREGKYLEEILEDYKNQTQLRQQRVNQAETITPQTNNPDTGYSL